MRVDFNTIATLLVINFGFIGLGNGGDHDLTAGAGLYGNGPILRIDGDVGVRTDVEPIFLAGLGDSRRCQTSCQRKRYNGGLL